VNLSHWFAQSEHGYGAQHLAGFVTQDDLHRIAGAGFGHVRLSLEPSAIFANAHPRGRVPLAEPVLAALHDALALIRAEGLAVVLDLHPVGPDKDRLRTPAGAEAFVAGWASLADEFKAESGPAFVLEILNEPEPLQGEAWWALQERALSAIRSAGASGPVIANGGGWSGVEDLVARVPYADRAVIYTIHCYAPLLFTHQAATWTWDVAAKLGGLGWPLPPEAADKVAAAASADQRARGFLRDQIAGGDFTREAFDAPLARLAAWQEQHGGPPIYVGEFGVYAKAAPTEDRLVWIRAARETFERRGWAWALWDNTPSFGFRQASSRALDPAMLRALGVGAS
jgi:aryl-phospho-beta-D-glucosidase BglC (GH1 family)